MGWYSALACAGAVSVEDGFRISNAMGLNSQTHGPGGQILLQIVDEDWRPVPSLRAALLDLVAHIDARADHRLALSIDLAGMRVFAGNEEGDRKSVVWGKRVPARVDLGGSQLINTKTVQEQRQTSSIIDHNKRVIQK